MSINEQVRSGEVVPLTELVARPPLQARLLSWLRTFWHAATLNRKVATGSAILAFFFLVALFGPFFVHGDPNAPTKLSLLHPSAAHLLGTTNLGQDIFGQLVVATRASVLWGFATGLAVTFLSVVIGLVGGYFGGTVSDLIALLMNIFLVLPALPLMIVLAAYFPSGPLTVSLVITFTSWAWGARVLRAQTLSMRNREFVTAARANGETTLRIIFFEILPNEISLVAASFVSTTIQVILSWAALAFVGLGDFGTVSWGGMLYFAQNGGGVTSGLWWWFVPPGLCIALLSMGLALINFGIDEVADPRLRSERLPKIFRRKKAVA